MSKDGKALVIALAIVVVVVFVFLGFWMRKQRVRNFMVRRPMLYGRMVGKGWTTTGKITSINGNQITIQASPSGDVVGQNVRIF